MRERTYKAYIAAEYLFKVTEVAHDLMNDEVVTREMAAERLMSMAQQMAEDFLSIGEGSA